MKTLPLVVACCCTCYYYGAPTLFTNYLNFHAAVRPVFLSLDAATGAMFEAGVSYRMANKTVSGYKLKKTVQ